MSLLFNRDSKWPLLGGGVITLLGLTAAILIGQIGEAQAKHFLSQSQNNINILCNTIVLSSSTILALLFTVLSLSSGTKVKLKDAFYSRIKQVAFFDTILFIITMFIFLTLNFPVEKSGEIPDIWYKIIYYVTAVSASIIGGMIVTVILLLYNTISDLIHILGFGADHHMAEVPDDEE